MDKVKIIDATQQIVIPSIDVINDSWALIAFVLMLGIAGITICFTISAKAEKDDNNVSPFHPTESWDL